MAESESSSRFSFFTSKKFLFILGGFVVVLALLAGGYYVWQKSYTQSAPAGQTDVEAVVGKVNKLMDLPTDEAPTLATVSDVNKLQGQEFFAKAQNGDQVLIYSKAKKAVLYRPSVDKIIEVGPVNIAPTQSETASSSAVASQTTEIKVALLNGTETVGTQA